MFGKKVRGHGAMFWEESELLALRQVHETHTVFASGPLL